MCFFFKPHSSSDISNACIIFYRFEHLPNIRDPNVDYIMTDKGYFDDEAFLAYIKFMVKHIPKDGRWRLLILDGYGTHTMSYETLQVLVNNKTHAICMPSHISSMLQSLDVASF